MYSPSALAQRRMRCMAVAFMVVFVFMSVVSVADAQRRSSGVKIDAELIFNSDYVYRGLSYTGGGRNIQGKLGMRTQGSSNLQFGVVVSSVAHANAEYRWYNDYELRIGPGIILGAHLNRYEYTGLTCTNPLRPVPQVDGTLQLPSRNCVVGQANNYDELGASLKLELTIADITWSTYESKDSQARDETMYNELLLRIPLLGVSGKVGMYSSGYQFTQIGVDRSFGRFKLGLSYLRPFEDASISDLLSNLQNVEASQAGEQAIVSLSVRF